MQTLLRAASAILVVAIAIVLVNTPSPRPSPPAKVTPIDYFGRNVYTLDWNTIYPGPCCHSVIVMSPRFFSVHSLRDVLRWVESMPSGTILSCLRYQVEIAEPLRCAFSHPASSSFSYECVVAAAFA
jgi:hypothetical protein